ncbi:unnamed protein product, partial [Mycena citricolor]
MSGNLKRKESTTGEQTGREKKKQKLQEARTIGIQSSGPGLTVGSGQRLRGAIDVERFSETRRFEINAMHAAMKSARSITNLISCAACILNFG